MSRSPSRFSVARSLTTHRLGRFIRRATGSSAFPKDDYPKRPDEDDQRKTPEGCRICATLNHFGLDLDSVDEYHRGELPFAELPEKFQQIVRRLAPDEAE